ncbi:MAG TPA: extracellular solute-binding protein [Trebonia sp.]|nr:extracellular solute-binding protein [Trebonia sp.]
MSGVRVASIALVIAAVAAVAAGCASAPGAGPFPPRASGPVTITILTGTDTSISPGSQPLNGATGMYGQLASWWNANEEERTRIRVRIDAIDGDSTQEHAEMLAAAQAEDASYDIYNLDNEWVSEFARAGYLWSLQGRLPLDGFLPQPLASGRDDAGQLYAAPFTTDVGLLYYRSDLVRDLSDLTTLWAVLQEAQQVQGSDPRLSVGYAGQFSEYEGLSVNLLEIIRGDAPSAIGPDGTIRDPGAVTGVLQHLVSEIGAGEPIPSPEVSSYTELQSYQAFAGGHAVFMRNWPIDYNLLTTPQSGSSLPPVKFGVVPLPFPSVLGGQDLAISASSAHPAEALQVVEFLTSAQAERCLFAVGGFPATRSTAYTANSQLPDGYQVAGQPAVTGQPLCGKIAGRQLRIGPTILKGIARAMPRPVTRYYTEYSTLFQGRMWPLLRAGSQRWSAIGGTVDTLATEIQAALSGHATSSSR